MVNDPIKTENASSKAPSFVAKSFLLLVNLYRYAISPLFPSRCRYYPTCSAYAHEAIVRYGAWTGGKLALKRILRCHPWASHGVDPVPELNPSHSCCRRNP